MTLARPQASDGTHALPSCSARSLLASRAAHRVGYVANRRPLAAPRDPRTLGRRSRSLHVDALVGAPRSYRGNGWLAALWTRTRAFFPPAVVYGWLTTSHSPVSSTRRSPIRSCIGRMRLVAGDAGSRFFSGRRLGTETGLSERVPCRALDSAPGRRFPRRGGRTRDRVLDSAGVERRAPAACCGAPTDKASPVFPTAARAGFGTLRPIVLPTHFHEEPLLEVQKGSPWI